MILRKHYLNQLIGFKDTNLIKVITGIRRCGKSVLLQQFADTLDDTSQKKYINFESLQFDGITDYKKLYDYVMNAIDKSKKLYLFLDEVQRVESWEKALSSFMVDLDVDIYITGSNAYLLSSELSTFLAGRYVEIHLQPLSFKEFQVDRTEDRYKLFDEYMKYGGFPGLLEIKSEQSKKIYMEGLYNSVVVKDILNRRKNLDTNLLLRILRYIIDNIGNLSSANKIANYISSNISKVSTRAVIDHIEALESAFIIYKVDRFKIVGKELLKTLNKHYIVDIGLRNMIEGYEIRDRGRFIENLVYNELVRRGYHVFVGVDNRFEVDFVASKDQDKRYYQVTLSIQDEKVRERELKGFNIIQDNYRKIVITMDYGNSIEDGIEYKNLIDFLLEDV